MNCTAFDLLRHANGQTHVWLIASSVKFIPLSALLSCTDSSHQDGFMLRLICMFLGCDMPIQLVLSSEYDDYEIVSSCTDSRHGVTFYASTNRLTRFLPVIYQ